MFFSNRRLIRFLGSNAVAVKVDIERFDGMVLKDEYNIQLLPTVLFFYPDGTVADRVERSMTASEIERSVDRLNEQKPHWA